MSLALSRIRDLRTGLVMERHSLDCAALISAGTHEWATPDALSIRERLSCMQNEQFNAFAKSAAVNTYREERDHVIDRLVPLVESGAITIPDTAPTHRDSTTRP